MLHGARCALLFDRSTTAAPKMLLSNAQKRAMSFLLLSGQVSDHNRGVLMQPTLFTARDIETLQAVRASLVHYLQSNTGVDVVFVLQEVIEAWECEDARRALRLMVAADGMKFGGVAHSGIYRRILCLRLGTPHELQHDWLLFQAVTYGSPVEATLGGYSAWYARVMLVLMRAMVLSGRARVEGGGVLSAVVSRCPLWAFQAVLRRAFPYPSALVADVTS